MDNNSLPDFVLDYLSRGYGRRITNDDLSPLTDVSLNHEPGPSAPRHKAWLAIFDARGKGATISPKLERAIMARADQLEGPLYAVVPSETTHAPDNAFLLHGDVHNMLVTMAILPPNEVPADKPTLADVIRAVLQDTA